MNGSLMKESGLEFTHSFAGDRQFYAALAAAPVFLILLTWMLPTWSSGIRASAGLILSMVLWQPLLEELLFRGLIQGQLGSRQWAQRECAGLSTANVITSLLFSSAHLIHHSPAWAAAVFVPSLIFGYFRDRHGQVYPALVLHAFYNSCYLFIGTGAN
jgi:membrane protease YdiL (CAAX protease family)